MSTPKRKPKADSAAPEAAAPPIPAPILAPGAIRVIGDMIPDASRVEVWCGPEHGWVILRGVVAANWSIDARRPAGEPMRPASLTLVLEPMLTKYLQALTPPESVALSVAGVTPAMLAAAEAAYERSLKNYRPRKSRAKAAATKR